MVLMCAPSKHHTSYSYTPSPFLLQHHGTAIEVWNRPLSNSAYGILFFSRSVKQPEPVTSVLKALGVASDTTYEITDVYDKISLGVFKPTDPIEVYVNPSGVVLLKATPYKQ